MVAIASLENNTSDQELFACPECLPTAREAIDGQTPTVVDNPVYAWRNRDEGVCFNQLHADFVHDYGQDDHLQSAAVEAMAPLLEDEWWNRGYRMVFGTFEQVFRRHNNPSDALYREVWDAAAYRIDPDQLVKAAGLDGIYSDYCKKEAA